MKRVALGLLLALSLSASAETNHPDGSVTLSKAEQDAILEYVAKLSRIIDAQAKKLEEPPKPGKCI